MSDIDRVFARMGGGHTTESHQRELRNVPRKGGVTGSRVVEVVRMAPRSGMANGEAPRRAEFGVRAQTWDDGFPARQAPPPPPAPPPTAQELPKPVVHIIAPREPLLPEVTESSVAAAAPAAEPVALPARRSVGRKPKTSNRRVANPFDPDDDGTNCLRCGYVIESAREKRGLLTCAACG